MIMVKIKDKIKGSILKLIELVEKVEYKEIELDQADSTKKIIDIVELTDIEVNTPQGFKDAIEINKTQPYYVWFLETDGGLSLECADDHLLVNELGELVFVSDLSIGDKIETKFGYQEVSKLKKSDHKVSMYDISVDSPEHLFYSNDIVSHNTTTVAAFFAWYLCFHTDRNLLILANKEKTAIEIISKVMDVFRGLPFFLKPGIVNAGATGMRLDNGCQLHSQATTKTASIGFTIHVLYADEFAHIAPNIVGEFWRSVYPTLASSEISQCIISSTPSGTTNLFFDIWDKSIKGKNTFMHKRVDYWEVPDHDEEWAAEMRSNFSDEYFAQEFELQFTSDSKLLLGTKESAFMKRIEQYYKFRDLDKTDLDEEIYRKLKWKIGFDPNKDYNSETDLFIVSVDTGEGREITELKDDNDYNILSIYRLRMKSLSQLRLLRNDEYYIKNMFRLEQVGLFRDNVGDEEVCAKVAKAVIFDQLGPENSVMLIEMNFNGKYFLSKFQEHDDYFDGIVLKTHHSKPIPGISTPKKKFGFRIGNDKAHFCKLGKNLIRSKTLVPNESTTILEFGAFGKDNKGKYRGISSHDDTVMATLNISRYYEETSYEDRLYDILDLSPDSVQKRMINELLSRLEESNEIEDDLFASLYTQNAPSSPDHLENIKDIFATGSISKDRFKTPINSRRPV